ncbi:unnamed protein product [Caenorhabditis nigoni]
MGSSFNDIGQAMAEAFMTDEQRMYRWFETNCPKRADKCNPVPYGEAMKECFAIRAKSVGSFFGRKRDASSDEKACEDASKKTFKDYCKKAKNEIPSCYQFYPTTSTTKTTTITTTTTMITTSKNMVPFIIGGIVGAIAVLAIGIVIFVCCRRKKSAGVGQSMTGTTVGGKKTTVKTTKTGTTTNTGTTKTGTTTAASTTRY